MKACNHVEELRTLIEGVNGQDTILTLLAKLCRLEQDWRSAGKGGP